MKNHFQAIKLSLKDGRKRREYLKADVISKELTKSQCNLVLKAGNKSISHEDRIELKHKSFYLKK